MPEGADGIDSARALARAAADSARVVVVQAESPDEAAAAEAMFSRTWGKGRGADPSTLQAIAHAGNPVLVARRGDEVLGALFSFLGWGGGMHVHSHMTAVGGGARSSGVGFALKLAQRAVCLENGVPEVRWTYDPLIRRNAHFNLWKLGATVSAFHPDFYGVLDDDINGTDRSDRFEVSWRLDSPRVTAVLAGRRRESAGGGEVGDPSNPLPDDVMLPADFEALRRDDPGAASEVRERSRVVFARALGDGARVRFTGTGYVFDRAEGAPTEGDAR
jgi:predicted GNAT superfamily acetyltransferase